MVSLRNKVVVITGASSGIGKAACIAFAKQGARVALIARRKERLEDLACHIQKLDRDCAIFPADVADPEAIDNAFDKIFTHFGRIDFLINNAGRGLKAEICDIGYTDWVSTIHSNLTGVFLCTKAAVKRMRETNGKGHILVVSSVAGRFGAPKYSAYCASKHGVTGFAKSVRWELRKYGIKISTIYPMRVDTEFFHNYPKKPHRRQMLAPEDVARYLVSLSRGNPIEIGFVLVSNFLKRIFYLLNLFRN